MHASEYGVYFSAISKILPSHVSSAAINTLTHSIPAPKHARTSTPAHAHPHPQANLVQFSPTQPQSHLAQASAVQPSPTQCKTRQDKLT